MVTNDLERWGLHELEGSGYDAGSSGVKPDYEAKKNVERSSGINPVNEVTQPRAVRKAEIRTNEIEPVKPVYFVAQPSVVDTRRSGIEPAIKVAQPSIEDTRRSRIEPVIEVVQPIEIKSGDIIPVNNLGESIVQRVHVPFQYSQPPLQSPPNTANDAVIAQALHEEFQKLAAAEAAGNACAKEKESVLVQTWVERPENPVPPAVLIAASSSGEGSLDYSEAAAQGVTLASVGDNHGHVTVYNWEGSNEDMDRRKGALISSASTNPSSQDPYSLDEDDRQLALALSEEYQQVDREVANRLTKLESMKHVLRTNLSFPTYEDASADHQRLADRLLLYGLAEQKIKGDGNCQFRALSDQLYRTPEHHKYVRKQVVKQLKASPEVYQNYVPMKYSDYLKNMAKEDSLQSGSMEFHGLILEMGISGVLLSYGMNYSSCRWGWVQFGVKISLITSFRDTCFIEIIPAVQKSKREIYLSFWAEVHYNSIYPLGDYAYAYAQQQQQSKKKNWIERLF